MGMAPLGQGDRAALRELALMGNEAARDGQADLAFGAGDVGELSFMWEEGYERAGELMSQLAVADRGLVRLQELSELGVAEAQHELGSFRAGS